MADPGVKARMSEAIKLKWRDPEYRTKRAATFARRREELVVPANVAKFAGQQLARKTISTSAAIRIVARKFPRARRAVLMTALTGPPFNLELGTVSNQIQRARSV